MDVLSILEIANTNSIFKADQLNYNLAIIPTVLIPLTGVMVLLTSTASIVAGWFGIKLKTEGPKQFLELLLTKKILISALILNFLFIGIYKAYTYSKNLPKPLFFIEYQSQKNATPSSLSYNDDLGRSSTNHFDEKNILTANPTLQLKEVWEEKIDRGFVRSGAISGSSIFYGSDDGHIYELSKETGKVIRELYIGTQVTPRPIIYHDQLFSGEGNHNTHHARIYAFNLRTGKLQSTFKTKGHTEGQPIIASYKGETLLFLVAGKDGIYAIDPSNMKEKWHMNSGHLDATANVENGVVYTGTGKEKGSDNERSFASAYEFFTGKQIWQTELPLSNWMHAIVGKKNVCYALGEIYFPSNTGLLYCLDKTTGAIDFSIPFTAPLIGKPLILISKNTETAIVSSFKGDVCAVDLIKQHKTWCVKTGKENTTYALSSPSYDAKRNLIWYASLDNGLYALDPQSGEIKIHWRPKDKKNIWNKTYAAVTIFNDSLFVADFKGLIRRLDLY